MKIKNRHLLLVLAFLAAATTLLSSLNFSAGEAAPEAVDARECIAPGTVTSFSPTSGSAKGGTVVSFVGTCFARSTTVSFDNQPLEPTVVSSTLMQVTTAEHEVGPVNVEVIFEGSKPITFEKGYTFTDAESASLTYDGNGNTKGQAPVDEKSPYKFGEQATVLESGDLYKEGFTFSSWSTDPNPKSGKSYKPGESIEMVSGIVLYAQWSAIPPPPITHTVTYALGGGTGTAPTQGAVAEGSTFVVASNTGITRTGYTFSSWSNGTSSFAPGAAYTMGTSDVTLTATWTLNPPITHTVTYALGGGTGTAPTQGAVEEGSTFAVASNAGITRTGYTFSSWSNGTSSFAPGATYTMGTSNVTLTATWTAIPVYSIVFNANGGTGTNASQSSSAAALIAANTYTRAGYEFHGWMTTPTGGTHYHPGDTYNFIANITLYVEWELIPTVGGGGGDPTPPPVQAPAPVPHTITFNGNGAASGVMSTQTSTSAIVLAANQFVRPGYSFAHWSTTAEVDGVLYHDKEIFAFSSDLTLYVHWSLNPNRQVTFEGNGAVGSFTQITNQSTALSANRFERSGYVFKGWASVSNGLGLTFSDRGIYNFDADLILFAQWALVPLAPIIVSEDAPLVLTIVPSEAKTAVIGVVNSGKAIPVVVDIPVGITRTEAVIKLTPLILSGANPPKALNLKVEILDSSGKPVQEISAPLVIRFNIDAGDLIVASSSDGLIWTNVPLMGNGRTTLNPGERDGYYFDENKKVVILTSHLTIFGFKVRQDTKFMLNITPSTILKGFETKVSNSGGNGDGPVLYQSLTSATCSVSDTGILKFSNSGLCKITAVKSGDRVYLHQNADVYQVNVKNYLLSAIGSGVTKKISLTLGTDYANKVALIQYAPKGSTRYLSISSSSLSGTGKASTSKKVPTGSRLRVVVEGKVVASLVVTGKS